MDTQQLNGFEVAIIGMAGRFPGAQSVEEYWRNIEAGLESVRPLTADELATAGISAARLADPDYVNAGAFLEDIEYFDAGLFGYSAKEAQLMDPQHRLLLETVWQALEHAGCAPDQFKGQIGLFAGSSGSSYLVEHLVNNPALLRQVSLQDLMYENNHDLLGTRVSYKLNLTGPSVVMGTACSTTLVLLHYACQALLAGDCDVALAGGARVSVPHKSGYPYAQGGILSQDGHCRSFDAKASGTISSNGVGVVVLKRLADALQDGDTIYAVIKGTAINNDGAQKVGFTAPSVEGQVEVIRRALIAADVSPASIGYIEAHGTGTHLGDPIEVTALSRAYRESTDRVGYCAIGSVKANIGHADVAAGIAGVIKATQMLHHAVIPPAVNFEQPNPEIDFDSSPFYVATRRQHWQQMTRRAGVSAFGIGGTNAHAILESTDHQVPSGPGRRLQVISVSGKSKAALQANVTQLQQWLADHPDAELADVAYTLHRGRTGLEHRSSVVCDSVADAVQRLSGNVPMLHSKQADRGVVFMFSGQGTQYPGMMRDLYATETVFREVVDTCATLLQTWLGRDIRELMFDEAQTDEPSLLYRTRFTQPALFVSEFALAKLLMSWGIEPRAAIGHSIGEYVAACLAGVFSLPDALKLVAARAAAMDDMPAGSMIAVDLSEADIQPFLLPGVAVAAVNAPELVVVSGESSLIESIEHSLKQSDVHVRKLHTSHAFHSAMMDACLPTFARAFDEVTLNPPQWPFISDVSGDWITDEAATSVSYWLTQLRSAVRFSEGVSRLLADTHSILLEVGPGRTLAGLVEMQLPAAERSRVVSTVRDIKRKQADDHVLLESLAQLWMLGVRIDWAGFYAAQQRRKLALPSYAFQRQRYWIDPVPTTASAAVEHRPERLPLADWFYQPVWQQAARPAPAFPVQDSRWLLFDDEQGVVVALARALRKTGARCWLVSSAKSFVVYDAFHIGVSQTQAGEIGLLFDHLGKQGGIPEHIVFGWGLMPARSSLLPSQQGLDTLLQLARQLSVSAPGQAVNLNCLVTQLFDVTGSDHLDPTKALLLGPCRVMSKEYEQIRCRLIDLNLPPKRLLGGTAAFDTSALLAELLSQDEPEVALRGRQRFVQRMVPVPLPISPATSIFRQGGVYLITGGFGGIGATVALHLAKQYQARLILTARHELPAEAEWANWLASHAETNEKSQRIRFLQQLNALGARVHVIAADIADEVAMKQGLADAQQQLGRVQGVIHAAGVADGALIQRRTSSETAAVLAPKVKGTLVLDALLPEQGLDCFVLCSSLASHIAPVGQVGYCAANAFQDAFATAASLRRPGTRYLAIGWDSWREVGMAVNSLGADQLDAIRHGILPQEGIEALERLLASSLHHAYTSTRGLPLPITPEAEATETVAESPETNTEAGGLGSFFPRPELSVPFVAPRNGVEACIRDIWQDKMGVAPLGVHDDFFELNGHSLMAVQIITEIKRKLKIALPTGVIYDQSTIAQLAESVVAQANQQQQPLPALEEA
ncbi:acyl transferase domain-containing protein/acyl carrier protein [Chitinivorax tropicus]|uniref:Acyl transferase domain-containing protein/acyl carrier protein n=1 Tax=Chitinivorax tropicus TaxID=714531 RepID=A0A840MEC5_9PROT|nr:type I polyketide synthase [Chitinivorax tropicus]MBB5016750.1 acyl transferase domain-containing protein/acyl carrier protein [Chitinivorax tropicus]